jgi:hypothetical protein
MKAAAAAADITPQPGPVLQGHYTHNPSTAVLFPLETRAIVFEAEGERAAIIALDVIGLESETVARIRERVERGCGIAPERVMVACSHTHCAPAALLSLGMTPSPEFMEAVESRSAQCVIEAAGRLDPAQLGVGCGSAHFNINRRPLPAGYPPEAGRGGMVANYGALVDRRVRVLRVERGDGSPLAVLFHYSCHPTTKSGSEGLISSDYPGIARARIERELACTALYMPGCFANIRPAILRPNRGFGSATAEELVACGEELGREVVRVARSLRATDAGPVAARRIAFEMPFGETKPLEELEQMAADDSERGRNLTGPWARRVLEQKRANALPSGEPTEMQSLRIGPLALVSIPGEPFQEIGHAIEKQNRGALGTTGIWPVGYTNDGIGYLCTDRAYTEGGYEPGAYVYYGRPAPFRGEEALIVETAARLLAG